MRPLRASTYTAHNVGRSRIKTAILNAAGAWYEARSRVTDCETAIANAAESDDGVLITALEYDRLDAVAHREHAYWQVYTMVCGYQHPDEWDGLANNGVYFLVVWSGPAIAQISIIPQN
jgi:hypothetical protein